MTKFCSLFFARHKTKDYSHIYTPSQRKRIMAAIKRVSGMLTSNAYDGEQNLNRLNLSEN